MTRENLQIFVDEHPGITYGRFNSAWAELHCDDNQALAKDLQKLGYDAEVSYSTNYVVVFF